MRFLILMHCLAFAAVPAAATEFERTYGGPVTEREIFVNEVRDGEAGGDK